MLHDIDQSGSKNAREALDSIQKMEQASLRRAIPPHWFGATLVLLTSLLFTLAGLEVSRVYMAPLFLIMVFIVVYQTRKSGVLVKLSISKNKRIIVMIGVVIICSLVIFFTQELRNIFGFWAPLTLGVLTAIAGLILFALERRMFFTKINSKKDK